MKNADLPDKSDYNFPLFHLYQLMENYNIQEDIDTDKIIARLFTAMFLRFNVKYITPVLNKNDIKQE